MQLLIDFKIPNQQNQHETVYMFFTKDGHCNCNDLEGLFKEIEVTCVFNELRLFINQFKCHFTIQRK